MSSKHGGFLVVCFLVGLVPAWTLGNAEITYSINGKGYLLVDGQLADELKGEPWADKPDVERPRYFQGGTGAGRALLHVASVYDQKESRTQEDYLFEPMGSGQATRALLNGQLDWAVITRDLLQGERDAGLRAVPVAWDALFVVVPASLAVESISVRKLAAIYVGIVTNWKDLGGPDLEIVPIAYTERSGNAGALRDLVLERVYGDDGRLSSRVRLIDYDADVFSRVGEQPGAVGFGALSFDAVEPGPGVRFLKVDNIEADPGEVLAGRYPLVRPLNFVTVGEPDGKAAQILDWLQGERLQAALPGLKLVPLR